MVLWFLSNSNGNSRGAPVPPCLCLFLSMLVLTRALGCLSWGLWRRTAGISKVWVCDRRYFFPTRSLAQNPPCRLSSGAFFLAPGPSQELWSQYHLMEWLSWFLWAFSWPILRIVCSVPWKRLQSLFIPNTLRPSQSWGSHYLPFLSGKVPLPLYLTRCILSELHS